MTDKHTPSVNHVEDVIAYLHTTARAIERDGGDATDLRDMACNLRLTLPADDLDNVIDGFGSLGALLTWAQGESEDAEEGAAARGQLVDIAVQFGGMDSNEARNSNPWQLRNEIMAAADKLTADRDSAVIERADRTHANDLHAVVRRVVADLDAILDPNSPRTAGLHEARNTLRELVGMEPVSDADQLGAEIDAVTRKQEQPLPHVVTARNLQNWGGDSRVIPMYQGRVVIASDHGYDDQWVGLHFADAPADTVLPDTLISLEERKPDGIYHLTPYRGAMRGYLARRFDVTRILQRQLERIVEVTDPDAYSDSPTWLKARLVEVRGFARSALGRKEAGDES